MEGHIRLTNPTDAESLQKDLDSLSTWSARWQLKFNPGIRDTDLVPIPERGHRTFRESTAKSD